MATVYDAKGESFDVPHMVDVKEWLEAGFSLEKPIKKPPPKKRSKTKE